MVCVGICKKYRAKKPVNRIVKNISRYALGHKLCRYCDMWILWDGAHCPCCNLKVRQRPRKPRGKELYNNCQQK